MALRRNNKAHSDIFLLDCALLLHVFATVKVVFGKVIQGHYK